MNKRMTADGWIGVLCALALLVWPILAPQADDWTFQPFRYVFGVGGDPTADGQLEVINKDLTFDRNVPLGWSEYSAAGGEARIAAGDLDGDGKDEIVIGFGAVGQDGLPGGRFEILDDDFSLLAWGQVDWPDYSAANGETRPAVGDIDGDGQAEIVIGLGRGANAMVALFRLAGRSLTPLGWSAIDWPEYAETNGETWPALGDLDGDGRAELVIGVGPGGAGRFFVKEGFEAARLAAGQDPWRDEIEGSLSWAEYADEVGETRPAVGDLNGDGTQQIVIGLGPSGGGVLEVFDYLSSALVASGSVTIDWPEYNALNGETRPVIGDIDGDLRGEFLVGLGNGGAGYVYLFDDAKTQFVTLERLQVGAPADQSGNGAVWPVVKREGPPLVYQLRVLQNGTGSGTVGGGGRYVAGTAVTATATVAHGSTLAGWTPSSCGVAFALTADTTCTATFTLLPTYTLTAKLSGNGAVTSTPAGIYCGSDCAAAYTAGTAVALSATASIGYSFAGWSGACTGTGGCTVVMGAAKTVTASFKAIAGYVERGITASLDDASRRQLQPLTAGPARYLETRSARALTLGFDSLDLAVATCDPASYTLVGPADGSPQGAIRVGGDRQAVGFDGANLPLAQTRLHLLFADPLRPGVDYRLDACAAVGGSTDPAAPCHSLPVRYDPTLASGSIQVDQVGYAPGTTKIAYLGNWLGSAGPLPVDATGFEVVDSDTGEAHFSGQARLTAPADPWSGNDVYQADFSTLDRPGRYRLRVPGLGVSDPFVIAADVYDAPYRAALRLFYHSRNSTAVVAPWADPGYERPQGGVPPAMDAAFHAAVAGSPLSAGSTTDTGPTARHAVRHGWFDSDDYGQYVPNAAPVWYLVGAALDLAPQRFGDGDLNIPESGNGIPDVLDELEWGLDWLLGMQDPADGGVWFRVGSRTWDAVPPYLIATPRLLFEKTSHATAAFAAACALHARLIRPYRPARAAAALAAARRAWDFLASHPDWPAEGRRYQSPTGVRAVDYSDASVRDNRLWAAAELYRTTGEAPYRTAVEALLPLVKIDPTAGVGFQDVSLAGLWAYLLAEGEGKNPTMVTQAGAAFIAAADWRVRNATAHPFRAPSHQSIAVVGWGSFAVSTRATLPLLQAYRLTGKTDYLDRAWQSPHPQLGANPQSLSYLTGFGARYPHFPLSRLTKSAGPGDPLKGIPVLGPQFLPSAEMAAMNTLYLPPSLVGTTLPTDASGYAKLYPALRRYTDARGLPPMSKPTVVDYAQVGLAFGLLRRAGLKEEIDTAGKVQHQLSVLKNGTGSGIVGGGGRYAAGTAVTPTATAAQGSILSGWTPSSCGAAFALDTDTTCMANFTLLPKYALTVILSGSGTVTSAPLGVNCGGDCTEAYVSGTTVTLTPAPASGYLFAGWSGACSGTEGCTVAMGAATSATATFKAIPATLERGITSSLADTSRRQMQPLPQGPARYLETRSARALTLGFDTLDLTVATRDPSVYTLVAQADPAYANPQAATRVGGDRQVVGFDTAKQPQVETRLHLLFPHPLRPGVDYRLDACGALGAAADPSAPCRAIPVRYDPDLASGSIQVDQVGYAPGTTKVAFLGNWLGSAGPLPVDATGFEVVEVGSGESVFSGQARLTAPADPWSGNDVYQADFTALDRPGQYRLRVPGLGVSDPFTIATDVYDAPYRAALRLFYHSRNSTPVVGPWAEPGYERPLGGVPPAMDAAFHAVVANSPLSLGSTTDTGPAARHPVRRGWFDAGDYGQYVPNAAPVWYLAGAALDLAPRRFGDGDLNIPESGNGIPDLLDELDWGLDWLLGMQDPTDGGVWFRVASRTWDGGPPHLIAAPRLLAEKTSHATAAFAAACALHARLIRPYRPARADEALAAARRAWDFISSHADWPAEGERYKNPADVNAGDYSDVSARDNRLWAAAELYRTTGEASYRVAFEALLPQVKIDPTAGVSFKDFALAGLWAYLLAPEAGKDPGSVAQARGALLAAADWRVRKANEHPFRAPTHQAIGLAGWGSFAVSTRATLPLLQAYRLTGKTDYLDRAWQSPHPQLGANPQSISYLTGFGARSPHFPLSKLTKGGVPGDPLQGIPVLGPQFHLPALWQEMTAVNAAYLPPELIGTTLPTDVVGYAPLYPVLRRYTDARGLPPMSEPTVADYAQVGLAFGLLRRGGLKEEIDALGQVP